jgi:3-hydroxyisobutyrate dehydrogenase
MKVGLIGLGAMGEGMARNLAKARCLTAVYNRNGEKAEKLAEELHVAVFHSAGALAAHVDVVLLCISADADVLAVIDSIAKTVQVGSIVIDMSTISSATAQQAAAWLAEKHVAFLDAPVSGGVEGAKNGSLAMMVGGDSAVLDKVRPILATMTARIVHVGDVGAGQAAKAVNQIMCAGINQAVTEALAFAEAQHLPMDRVIEVISNGASGNWFLQHRGTSMTNGSFAPGFKVALHHKDLKICQMMAETIALRVPLVNQTVVDYEQLMADGYGDEDISALYRLKKPQ